MASENKEEEHSQWSQKVIEWSQRSRIVRKKTVIRN